MIKDRAVLSFGWNSLVFVFFIVILIVFEVGFGFFNEFIKSHGIRSRVRSGKPVN
jgi:hypothetical protein